MGGERRENIVPVEVAIERVLEYRRQVAMLQFTIEEDLKDLMPLQVLSSHSSPSHSPRPLERPSASASPVPSTNHSVLSSISSPSHSPRPLEGPSSSSSPSPSLVPSTNLSGIKRKELTNCLQYLQPEQPRLSHEPYYDEDLPIPNSPDISGAERQPSLSNVPKRVRHDLLQRDYVTKAPFTEMQTRKFLSKGSVMEMPSSFNEDETAENSSSQELGASS